MPSSPIRPTLYLTTAVANDPDWAGTQVVPDPSLRISVIQGTKKIGVVVLALDAGGAVVSGSIGLQAVDVSDTLDDPTRAQLVSGGAVATVPLGTLYEIDVNFLSSIAVRRVATVGVVGATALKWYWRVLE